MYNSTAILFAKSRNLKTLLSLIKAANEQGIEVTIISHEEELLKFSKNNHFIISQKYKLPFNRQNAFLTINKNATKIFLNEYAINTPRGIKTSSSSAAIEKIKKNELAYPLVVKPIDGSLARGVSLNIVNQEDLKKAINICQNSNVDHNTSILIEEMVFGDEYRVLVLNNKVIAVAKKIPTKITGDGKSTITELIEQYNKTRLPNYTIKITKDIKDRLSKLNLTLASIISSDEEVQLLDTVLMRAGGRCIDYTQKCPNKLKEICIKSAKALGLTYVGIDVIAKIDTTNTERHELEKYAVLEVNNNPVHIINEKPLCENATVDVSKKLLHYFFKNDSEDRSSK